MTTHDPNMQAQAQQMPAAISAGWFYVPYQAIGSAAQLKAEKDALTYLPKFAEDGDQPIQLYRDLPKRGYLGVPRAYGMARWPWLPVDDRRTYGEPMSGPPGIWPDPNHPAVKEPERQAAFMEDMYRASQEHHNFIAEAATGSGKTIVSLSNAFRLGRKTLVLVPLERLMWQWIDEIKEKLGLEESRIGRVQGPTCQYEGKDVVVGMMHSLSQRFTYPRAFYNSFGTVYYDEVHRTGSLMMAQCMPLFPAIYRQGLSATVDRIDGGDRVPYWHIGPIKVRSKAKALECNVYVKRFKSKFPLWGNNHQTRAKALAADPWRNATLVDLIQRSYNVGRHILVIGKFVDHLQDLMDLCAQSGIPAEEMGQFTGERLIRRQGRDSKGRPKMVTDRKVKVTNAEYDRIKEESRIIFATYGVFKEGIDVPRLDCGIDVLPQSQATQVIGRIRRPKAGKPVPYWITMLDEECNLSRKMFDKRCKDYMNTGCRIIDNGKI